jgi:hypothetical protein
VPAERGVSNRSWPTGDIVLIQPTRSPAMILIKWPLKPTLVEPVKLQATVAAI